MDALLLLNTGHIRYLTGFTGSEGVLLVGPDWMTLLVDGRYVTQARGEASGVTVFEFRNRVEGIATVLGEHRVGSLGFEAAVLTVGECQRLGEKLAGVKLEALDQGFQDLRAVKDDHEVRLIREAARIAGQALVAVRGLIRPGIREREIALELDYRVRQRGGEQVSFETIVAPGANSALPHATPGDRLVAAGDGIVLDYGAVFSGYHSDETCTWFVGCTEVRQREVYDWVRKAHDRAIAAIRGGVACEEIDRVVRATLAEA
ncbi:MAG: Xaa-Pro peptidase family protein, partial [Syntrophaceae bacterium]|nr:Xaa-Pro peptidase family protein [Syntrophaceae bacterium]